MRKKMVAGNWKMNKSVEQARQLVAELAPEIKSVEGVDKVFCPPFTALMAVSAMLVGTDIGLGAQNLFWEASGAYTGEVSPQMVKELCDYVIIGHSERRTYFGETDETVNRKVKSALGVGLIPIVCVGETLAENEAGETARVVTRQVHLGLQGLNLAQISKLVIAYEPVWAIGTGRAATSEGANAVHKDIIRPTLAQVFGAEVAQGLRILYGGSVTAANAAELFAQPDIDGGLVGGASLKPAEFIKIVKAAAG